MSDYLNKLFGLSGKTALVTGGAVGIGRMCSEALVRAGARVMIASRKGSTCEAVAAELNALGAEGQAEGFAGDVGTEAGVAALAAEVKSRTPRLDILVPQFAEQLFVDVGSHDLAASLGEGQRRGAADPLRGGGDEDGLS